MPTSSNLTATSQSPLIEMETDEERWDDIEIPLSGLIVQGEPDEMVVDNDDESKENHSYSYHANGNGNGGLPTTTGGTLRAAIMGSDGNVGEIMRVSSKPPSLPSPKESSYDSRLLKNINNYNTNNVGGNAKNKIRVGVSSKFNPSSDSTVTKTNTTSHASKQRRIIKEGAKAIKSIFCASELANFPVPKSTLNGKKEFTGTITRLGGESKKVVDMSDWDNDMEIPDTGLSLSDLVKTRSPISNKSNETDKVVADNDENFDNWDEEFQDFGPEESCLPQSQNRNIVIKRVEEPTSEKTIESFDQDFDLLDVDIDKLNLSTKALKVHSNGGEGCEESVDLFDSEGVGATTEIHSRNSSALSSSASPSSGSHSEDEGFDDIQIPESMDSLRLLPHFHSPQVRARNEDSNSRNMNTKDHRSFDDDNDDWSGLEVQDVNVFEPANLKHKNIVSRTVPAQQKRPRRESFTIEFSPPSLTQPATENSPDSPRVDCSSMMIDNPQSPGSSSSSSESATKKQVRRDSVPSITRSTVSSSKKVTSHPKREVVASTRNPPATSFPCGHKPNTVAPKSGVSSTPKEKGKPSATSNKKGSPKKSNSSVSITAGSIKENLNSLTLKHKKAPSTCSKSTCSDSSEKSARSLSPSSLSSKSSSKNSKKSSSSSTSKKPFSLTSTKSLLTTKKSTADSKTPRPHPISQSTTKSQPKPKIRLFNNSVGNSLLVHRKNKTKEYGDGTELDGFDDLPVCLERERDFKTYSVSPVFGVANNSNDNDVKESVFQNLSNLNDRKNSISSLCSKASSKSSSVRKKNKRKKPPLIRNLNSEKNAKVIGEMVYDPILQRWDGNESVLKDFELPPTRPALITNMSPSTNTKSLQVVGDMVFDAKKMCWFHRGEFSSEEEECLALFDFESDCGEDDMPVKCHTTGGFAMDGHDYDNYELTFPSRPFSDDENLISGKRGRRRILNRNASSSDISGTKSVDYGFQVGSEFEVSKRFLESLKTSEDQHRKEMNRWYPAIRSISNEQRFGLKDNNFQRGFLYEIRKSTKAGQSNTAKKHRKGNPGGLSRCHERPHFR